MKDKELLVCSCGSMEHQLIFTHDEEDNQVYVHVHLTKRGFWNRLKYLFGYQCAYGAFEETLLDISHVPALKNIIFKLENGK